jgi:hypothetical protein
LTGNIVVVNMPKNGLDETTAFPYILREVEQAIGQTVFAIWGTSFGAQNADRFHDWYCGLSKGAQIGPIRWMGFISPLGGFKEVKMG